MLVCIPVPRGNNAVKKHQLDATCYHIYRDKFFLSMYLHTVQTFLVTTAGLVQQRSTSLGQKKNNKKPVMTCLASSALPRKIWVKERRLQMP